MSVPLIGSLALVGFFLTFLIAAQIKGGNQAIVPSS